MGKYSPHAEIGLLSSASQVYNREPVFSQMKTIPLLLAGAFLVVFSVGLGFVLTQQDALAPAADGSVNQSPFLYAILFVGILAMGALFSRVYNAHSPDKRFSFLAFVNVAVAAILIGGVIHELVHIILLQHPAQFRVHFGDVKAVFSTCCLAPGERPYEEIAYAVQFFVGLIWIFMFRSVFFTDKGTDEGKTKGPPQSKKNKMEKKEAPRAPKKIPSAEDEIDDEWNAQKRVLDHYLNPKAEHPHHVRAHNQLEGELDKLNRLKFKREK